MKPLIIIPSCARDRYICEGQERAFHLDAQRALLDLVAYRLFLGVGNCDPHPDEVILPVRDDYWALPQKVRAAFRWALEQVEPDGSWQFDYFFKCDRDTFIHADRLLASMREHFEAGRDYVGLVGNPGDCCGGGAGYILSRLAAQTYLDNYDERQLNLSGRQQLEDWCVFWTLDRANPRISPVCDRRYWDLRLGPVPDPETNITWNPWKP